MNHSFCIEIAKQYSVPQAIILQHFGFWYKKVLIDGVNYKSGRYWVRMKILQIHKIFPYYSTDQIRRCVEKLIANELLLADEFNDKKNDRTKWYSLTNTAKELLAINDHELLDEKPKKVIGKIANNVVGKIASPSGKIANSINKEVDNKKNIYLEKTAFDFLLEENPEMMESWLMKNKSMIADWERFKTVFNCVVDEEGLIYEQKKLLARLNRLRVNWRDNDRNNNKVRHLDRAFHSPGPKVMHY